MAAADTERGKRFILAAVCLAGLVLPLSLSGGAVATPAIGREFGSSAVALTWFTNAFMLSFGSLLMAAGALADQFGRKRIFVTGMALFAAVSLALACAPLIGWLDGLRVLQGMAAAAALSSGSAALAQEFEGHAMTRAFSLLGTTFGVSLAFGPLAAGLLINAFSWRAVFVAAALLASLALLCGMLYMRETRDPDAAGLDWAGSITFTGTLALFTFGVIAAPAHGWGSTLTVATLTAAGLLLVGFILIESRVARPMLDLSLFRYFRFVGVQILPLGTCVSYIVLVVLLPLRLIGVEGMSEVGAGLTMVALSLPMMVVPALAAAAARKVPPGILSGAGFAIAAAGLEWLGNAGVGDGSMPLLLPMLVIGIGAGIPWGLMDGLAISVVPRERAGMATGIFNTARVAGEGMSLAVVSAILASLVGTHLAALSADGAMEGKLAEASQRIAAGDLTSASALLPQLDHAALAAVYGDAFRVLVHVLAAVTALAAFAAFALLSGKAAAVDPTVIALPVAVPETTGA